MTSTLPAGTGTPLSTYVPVADRFDEMVDGDGRLRDHWSQVGGALDLLGLKELSRRQGEIARMLDGDGVHYHVYDDGRSSRPSARDGRRWRLDPVPVVIASDEWQTIERGIVQRAELLEAILADLYGPQDLLRHGLLHPAIVQAHPGYLRPLVGTRLPGPSQLVTAAFDLARGTDGSLTVVADRTQAPSGAGYALQDRNVISRVFPSLYRTTAVHRLAPFFRSLRSALQTAAPRTTEGQPRIVVLSPGPWNETAFEHAFLANELGFGLVEGSDLVVRGGRVHLRSLDALEPVDVILRRVDAAWCDPLELRGDSQLGVPGLVGAVRRGNVSIANPLGSGLLENPALMAALPALSQHVLGAPLRLPSVRTWWCGDDDARAYVLDHLDRLVIKPLGRRAGRSLIHGARLTAEQRRGVAARIQADPWSWVGQAEVELATSPVLTSDGLEPRPTLLRTFVVAHEGSYQAMPGGLTRVAAKDRWLVSGQAGAMAKDTWVVTSEPESVGNWWLQGGPAVDAIPAKASMSSRAAENLFWFGRYAERAEGAVRLLRVVANRRTELQGPTMHQSQHGGSQHQSQEGASRHEAQHATVDHLLAAVTRVTGTLPGFLGAGAEGRLADPDTELRAVIGDPARVGSLATSIQRMTGAAQVVRDQLSPDVWLSLTTLEHQMEDFAADDAPLEEQTARYGRLLQSLLAIQGLAFESMVRDPGWRFMDAGRRLERCLQVLSLLQTTVVEERDVRTESLLLESVLTASESIVTYRRRYRSTGQLATALDLLLLAADNPRSVANQLGQLVLDLQALPTHPGPGEVSPAEEPVRTAIDLLRQLADTSALATAQDGRRHDLGHALYELVRLLRQAADVLDDQHFTHLQPQRTTSIGSLDLVEELA